MHIRFTTETKNRLLRFYRNKRAFVSLLVLIIAYLLSLTSPWTVNDEPLYLKYNGKSYFFDPTAEIGGIQKVRTYTVERYY